MEITWKDIVNALIDADVIDANIRFDVTTDRKCIVCKTFEDANCIADFLQDILHLDVIHVAENEDVEMYKYEVYPD